MTSLLLTPPPVTHLHVPQAVVHGIPTVLIPPQWAESSSNMASPKAAQPQKQPSTAAQGQTEKRVNAVAGRLRRRLFGGGIDTFSKTAIPMNAVETQIRSQTRSMFREAEDRWS
jgi:hypothetical protein